MPDTRTIYPCSAPHHGRPTVHTHSRVGSSDRFRMSGSPADRPDWERQHGPDGQQLLFSTTQATTTFVPPTDRHLRAEDLIEPVTTSEPDSVTAPVVYRCTQHTASSSHAHSRWMENTDETHPWDGSGHTINTSRGPYPPSGWVRHCAPDGTEYRFANGAHTTDLTQPPTVTTCDTTPEGSSMTDTYQPGDIVIATSGRPYSTPERPIVLIGIHEEMSQDNPWWCTLQATADSGTDYTDGWTFNRRGNEAPEGPTRAVLQNTGHYGWNINQSDLRHATPEEQEALPPEMELVRRRIQIAVHGSEPILLCGSLASHPSEPHRHARGRDNRLYNRTPDSDSDYRPIPGLWAGQAYVTTTLPVSQVVTDEPTAEPFDIYPLTEAKLAQYPVFTLHSKVGERRGNDIVFGCQTFSMAAIADKNPTIEFLPGSRVRVIIEGRRSTASPQYYVVTGDRERSIVDVNDWSERIMVDPSRVPPTPTTNAVIMQHGYYGCATHDNEVLHLFRGEDGRDRLAKLTTGNPILHGIIGQTTGFRAGHFRDCVPVSGATNAVTMSLATTVRTSLVPITEAQHDTFPSLTHGTVEGDRITEVP